MKCQEWSLENGVTFSTDKDANKSKTKVMVIGASKKKRKTFAPICLYDTPLPFVRTIAHLGHTLNEDGDMKDDIKIRKAVYIRKMLELKKQIQLLHPREFLELSRSYCGDYYGYGLWETERQTQQ